MEFMVAFLHACLNTGNKMSAIKINKYLPLAILYFFFNGFLLPHGLLYTTLLTPLFIIWLYRYPSFNLLYIFFIASIPFMLMHFINGVNILDYIKSYLLLFSVYFFAVSFQQFLKNVQSLPSIFKSLIVINIFFVGIALIILMIPSLRSYFWYNNPITSGIEGMNRLRMLTYEPSYYSTLLLPIALYYYLKMLLTDLPNKALVFFLVTVPLLLSLSFGVILGLILSLTFLFLSDIKLFTLRKKFPLYFIYGIILLFVSLIVVLVFFPDNVFFLRIANVFAGKDTSFRGRTFDSFYLGWKIAEQKSILFGVGPGQTKSIGLEFFKEFYNYSNFTESDIGIPNGVGDTLATFGILGVLVRLTLQTIFFFKTRVYNNFYRLGLFLFVFIYQFTGSFITNIAEYIIWIMAFSPWLFKEFDKKNIYANNRVENEVRLSNAF
jgi:hypothetical protein